MRLRHFTSSEFDSPDQPGSGRYMDQGFLERLDNARERAGVAFRITSGFRTPEHQASLEARGYKVSPTSAHLKGLAADILCETSHHRWIIIQALLGEGFTRIGIADDFIHVDADRSKNADLIWVYS